MYQIEFSEEATKELLKLMKSDVQAYKKFESLIPELQEHPYTETGHPHQLRHVNGIWSRKLDKKNRLRYMVNDTTIVVLVLSAIGHYDDK
jgi:addiction module toxin, txe/yoeB family